MNGSFPPGFQWDEEKNQANIAKHGIDFRDAVRIFEKPTLDLEDTRKNYEETRINSLGELNGQFVLNVTHTSRDGQTRLISARLAKEGQRAAYREFEETVPSQNDQPQIKCEQR